MTSHELTFGVEIETVVRDVPFQIGGRHTSYRIREHQFPELAALDGWSPQRDGSINAGGGYRGCEFVSPILRGKEGLKKLYEGVSCIKNVVRARVNASCGVHVHVGFPKDNPDALKRLVHMVACHERALYASSGTPRREQGSWCHSLKRSHTSDIKFDVDSHYGGHYLRCNQSGTGERYRILNLTNLLGNATMGTVEFRVFSESNNPKKILAWTRLCLALVDRALNTSTPAKWEHNDKALVEKRGKGGEGFKAVKLIAYHLGWVRGRSFVYVNGKRENHAWGGELDGIDGLPTLKQSYAEIKKLARSYDKKVAQDRQIFLSTGC